MMLFIILDFNLALRKLGREARQVEKLNGLAQAMSDKESGYSGVTCLGGSSSYR